MKEKKVLHLNLKRQWFDLIIDGEKEEEYREIKSHWVNRIVEYILSDKFSFRSHVDRIKMPEIQEKVLYYKFDTIIFSNGYAKERPQFEIELKGISVGEGNVNWGAKKGEVYFVLRLGKIINKVNC